MESLKKLLYKKAPQKTARTSVVLDDKTAFFIFRKMIREEFGSVGAEKFIPEHFSNQTLFIKTTSSPWASELRMHRGKIIRKINQALGDSAVREIKIK
jgi:predicted nucleic acid-binding Zn ribbon protein